MNYKIIVFLLFSHFVWAQDIISVDDLMKTNYVKVKTQLACNTEGENCIPELIQHYDQLGRLTLKKTFSGDSLKETNRYVYNRYNQAVEVYTTLGDGVEFLNIKYEYDAHHRLTKFDACYLSGRCEPFERYQYRTDGKLSSRTRYRDGKYFYEYRHKYDKRGNNTEILILSNDSDSGEREVKTYDSKNNHASSRWVDYQGVDIDYAEYTYDNYGRLLRNHWIGGLSTQKLYKYDKLGNNVEYTSIDYNNMVDDHRVMTYDGNLITSRVKDDGRKTTGVWKFEYEKW